MMMTEEITVNCSKESAPFQINHLERITAFVVIDTKAGPFMSVEFDQQIYLTVINFDITRKVFETFLMCKVMQSNIYKKKVTLNQQQCVSSTQKKEQTGMYTIHNILLKILSVITESINLFVSTVDHE